MISADSNIFVYAANRDSPYFQAARNFLQSHQSNREFVVCELVLVEIYMCLRNKSILRNPLSVAQAVGFCDDLRSNESWKIVDTAPEIRADLWKLAGLENFPPRGIINARLALSLVFHGVKEFATVNVKDFEGFGFSKVWNPLLDKSKLGH